MEDPATGSAAAAAVALIAQTEGQDALFLQVHQGEEMGRPSLMLARAWHQDAQTHAQVGGACVAITEGTLPVE